VSDKYGSENFSKFKSLVKDLYCSLHPEQKTVVISLFSVHRSGVLLPLMLVLGRCSGEEYGDALLSAVGAHPMVFEPEWDEYRKNLIPIRNDAYIGLEYIAHYYDESQNEILKLIKEGESRIVEFKSTLRWNLHSDSKDPAIEHASLRTICAFLNTEGGTLLIGVGDEGSIKGIAADQFQSRDKFNLHFTQIVKDRLGVNATEMLRTRFAQIDGKEVFIVDAPNAKQPVFMKGKNNEDEFFVRTGPQTVKLGVREALEYTHQHFKP